MRSFDTTVLVGLVLLMSLFQEFRSPFFARLMFLMLACCFVICKTCNMHQLDIVRLSAGNRPCDTYRYKNGGIMHHVEAFKLDENVEGNMQNEVIVDSE